MARTIHIDPLSTTSLRLEVWVNDRSLSTATGFLVKKEDQFFLITNWHVVSGRDPDSNEILSPTGACPEVLRIIHHHVDGLGNWIVLDESLYDSEGNPRWIEHPAGSRIDVVALPLQTATNPQVRIYKFDLLLAHVDMVVLPAMPVSIIGYPFGLATGTGFPIWKTGHVASDPNVDYDSRPTFLIDATTRGGMSGSPVVLRLMDPITSKGRTIGSGLQTRFLGVYSGRIHEQSEIGRVWRPQTISTILDSV